MKKKILIIVITIFLLFAILGVILLCVDPKKQHYLFKIKLQQRKQIKKKQAKILKDLIVKILKNRQYQLQKRMMIRFPRQHQKKRKQRLKPIKQQL